VPIIPDHRRAKFFSVSRKSRELRPGALSEDQLKTLDEASRIELGFPGDMFPKAMTRAMVYGGMRDQILA